MDLGHQTDLGVEPTPGTGRGRPRDARDVVILRWPDEAGTRTQLVIDQVPRLLLLDDGSAPPLTWDDHEDWIRPGASRTEIVSRTRRLAEARPRPARPATPVLDATGELVGPDGARVRVPAVERRLLALLLHRRDRVVTREALSQAAWPGEPGIGSSLGSRIATLRRRVEGHGIAIHTVRGHGYLLEVPLDRSASRPAS